MEMNKFTIKFLTLITLFFYTGSSFSQVSQFRDATIDSIVHVFREKWDIPGISVAIAKDGRLVYAKGFGFADTTTMELVTPHSLFRIASCSKTITAMGIMKLIQDKKLGIDDTVFGNAGILDKYNNISDERILKITVKNLLQQTIGWQKEDIVGSNKASYALKTPYPATPDDMIRFNLSKELDFAPATDFRYSNFNYLVLGEIINKVSERRYEEYILQNVLHPIGVYATKTGKTKLEDRAANEVHYYDYIDNMVPNIFNTTQYVPYSYGGFHIESMAASGGWLSRPIDLVKIILVMDGHDILNRETITLMTTTPENIKSNYAMGWSVTDNSMSHTGALTWGTSAIINKSNNGICFAITCNTLPSSGETMEEMMQNLYLYMNDLYELLPETLMKITEYPTIDLFNQLLQR